MKTTITLEQSIGEIHHKWSYTIDPSPEGLYGFIQEVIRPLLLASGYHQDLVDEHLGEY